MNYLATYLHPQTFCTSKPIQSISFIGHSFPYYNQVRQALAKALAEYPTLPLRKAQRRNFESVHTPEYLRKLALQALENPLDQGSAALPELSIECQGLEYCLPGYLYGLGGMMEAIDQMKKGNLERAYCFSMVGHCNIPILNTLFPIEVLEELGLTGQFYDGHESIDIFQKSLDCLPWQPDLITIFSGYDSHRDDCGKSTTGWTNADFCQLTEIVLDSAQRYRCPVLSSHGGGYRLPVTVAAAVAHVKTLATYTKLRSIMSLESEA